MQNREKSEELLRKTIGENLRATRNQLKLSLQSVEVETGYSKSKLSEWETAIRPISLKALFDLATFYGVSIDYLTGSSVDPIEARSSADYVRMLREVSASYMDTVALMMASGINRTKMKESYYTSVSTSSRDLIEIVEWFINKHREQFEEMQGGNTIMYRLETLKNDLKRLEAETNKAHIEEDPKAWAKAASVIKQKLNGQGPERQRDAIEFLGQLAGSTGTSLSLDFD